MVSRIKYMKNKQNRYNNKYGKNNCETIFHELDEYSYFC